MSDNTGVVDSSTVSSVVDPASMETTISFEKITDVEDVIDRDNDVNYNNGYRLINMEMLANLFSPLTCQNCHESDCLQMEEDADKKKGLATFISIKCCYCDYQNDTYTSKSVAVMEKSNGMKTFDVNIRTVYAMRSIGVGYVGLEKICGLLDMPKPMTPKSFDNLANRIREAVKVIAERIMVDGAEKLREVSNDVGVSFDGTWQKRGFSSLNGVVAAISITSGKVIDTEVVSRFCKACSLKQSLKTSDNEAYLKWEKEHIDDCVANYSGSAPGMEQEGAKRIFGRSEENRGLKYTHFYGDGAKVSRWSKIYIRIKK